MRKLDYKYSVDECDVINKEALTQFREKRLKWVDLLECDGQHHVGRQLSSLIWNDAVFRLFNYARRFSTHGTPTASVAPLLREALDTGYVVNMVLGVSRLTDPGASNPQRGVVSLSRILSEIKEFRPSLTREIYVCYNGIPYEPAPPPLSESTSASVEWAGLPVGGPQDFISCGQLHAKFDSISDVQPARRKRSDIISCRVFDEIEFLLKTPEIARIRKLRNRSIAHSADEISRSDDPLQNNSITLGDIEAALRSLVIANSSIQIDLLWNSSGDVMPTASFDIMEYLSEPFVLKNTIPELSEFWDSLAETRNRWTDQAAGGA